MILPKLRFASAIGFGFIYTENGAVPEAKIEALGGPRAIYL
jgi:hypothetical protein